MEYKESYTISPTLEELMSSVSEVAGTIYNAGPDKELAELKNKIKDLEEDKALSKKDKEYIKQLKNMVTKYGKQADKYLAVSMVILEGYLDEDVTDEDDIIRALLNRVDEISRTSMCSKMEQRVVDYKNHLEDTDESKD